MTDTADVRAQVQRFQQTFDSLRTAIHRLIVGQEEVVEGVLVALFAGGHVLLEGVPGIGKTMLVKTLGEALHLLKGRIQFTPDLMPADVLGTMVLEEGQTGGRHVRFQPGPIHTNLLLADEINRATPKTQSALLEAMQELQATVGGQTRTLPRPFVVLATQNPVEQEGTYPLPEAQLDRFLFKLLVGYPKESEYAAIIERTTGGKPPEIPAVTSGDEVLALRQLVREVPVPEAARTAATRLVMATQPHSPHATERVNRFVMLGSSPRGAQALVLAGKVQALREGRHAVAVDDVRRHALASLRHRMLLNFDGLGQGLKTDDLLLEILEQDATRGRQGFVSTTAAELFDAAFVQALEGLRLLARSVPAGGRHAEQRSRARGGGQEFTDVRPYVPGDDFRTVDWHVFLRLDRVFVRLFLEDQDLPVYLLLDQSASMARGPAAGAAPDRSVVARRTAAALAYVALNHMDRVGVHPFAGEPLRPLPGMSGKSAFQRLLAWLAALPAQGGTGLCEALRTFAARRLRRGLCVLVSDCFDPRGAAAVLQELRRLPHRPLIVRPVHAGEDRPAHLYGEVRAVDCETGAFLEVSVDDALLDRYQQAYRAFEQQLADFATGRGGGYLAVRTDAPLVPQLAQLFRHGVFAV